jgi:glycosyltransferase involved in cell wall biosynthesis
MSSAAGVDNPRNFETQFVAQIRSSGTGYSVMKSGSFRNPMTAALELRRTAHAFRPDLAHIHLPRGLLARSLSALRLPTVYTQHNVTPSSFHFLFKLYDRHVDRYVAIGQACRRFLEKRVHGPIVSIPNGVPVPSSVRPKRAGLTTTPLVIAVGGLRAVKDYPTLIEAAAIAGRRFDHANRPIRFAIAGAGAEFERLAALVNRRGLSNSFELLGVRSDVANLMQQADLLVNCSLHEGLPIALAEAAMAGLPIVATAVGGNSEVVVEGVNGYLVPPGRADLLAARIWDALSDEDRYVEFSTRSVSLAQRFTLSHCADAHLALYGELLAQ